MPGDIETYQDIYNDSSKAADKFDRSMIALVKRIFAAIIALLSDPKNYKYPKKAKALIKDLVSEYETICIMADGNQEIATTSLTTYEDITIRLYNIFDDATNKVTIGFCLTATAKMDILMLLNLWESLDNHVRGLQQSFDTLNGAFPNEFPRRLGAQHDRFYLKGKGITKRDWKSHKKTYCKAK